MNTKIILTILLLAATAASAAEKSTLSEEIDAEYGFVGGGLTLQGSRHLGTVQEQNFDCKYVLSPQVTKDLLLRFGAEWQRFSFGVPQAGAVPDTLQAVSAVLGCDYSLGDQWLIRAEIQPGLYGDFRDTTMRNFDVPFVLGGAYLQGSDVQWFLGLRIDIRSHYPVLPAIGVRRKFTDEWTLNLQFPKPRLEYEVNKNLTAYAGASVETGTFVVNDHFGDDRGNHRLNHATVDYFEARVGPGLAWKALPNLTVEADGGYMLGRWWDFFAEKVHLSSRPAPYVELAVHGKF